MAVHVRQGQLGCSYLLLPASTTRARAPPHPPPPPPPTPPPPPPSPHTHPSPLPPQSENEALQKLLVQLAADRESAERKLAEVKQQYSGVPAEKEALAAELDTGTMPAKLAEIAAASAPPPPQAAKPPPPETAKPKPALLQQMAERAMAQGQRVFVVPEGGAPVGQTVVLYYERTRGPLPGNADIGLKVGAARPWLHLVARARTVPAGLLLLP